MSYCQKCGKDNATGKNFCVYCGTKSKMMVAEPPPPKTSFLPMLLIISVSLVLIGVGAFFVSRWYIGRVDNTTYYDETSNFNGSELPAHVVIDDREVESGSNIGNMGDIADIMGDNTDNAGNNTDNTGNNTDNAGDNTDNAGDNSGNTDTLDYNDEGDWMLGSDIIQELVGEWIVDYDMTDMLNQDNLWEAFGSSISYGSGMEFSSDGLFNYGIAAGYGGEGSYSVQDDKIYARIVTYENSDVFDLELTIHHDSDNSIYIVMEYMDSYWGEIFEYKLVWVRV